eukprot:4305329-Pleurochrysis_carterae.AAC.1
MLGMIDAVVGTCVDNFGRATACWCFRCRIVTVAECSRSMWCTLDFAGGCKGGNPDPNPDLNPNPGPNPNPDPNLAKAMARLLMRAFRSRRSSQSTPVFAVSPAAAGILSRALEIIRGQARFA